MNVHIKMISFLQIKCYVIRYRNSEMEEYALLDSHQFGADSRSLSQFSHPYDQVCLLISYLIL